MSKRHMNAKPKLKGHRQFFGGCALSSALFLLCDINASALTLSWDVGSGGTNGGGVVVSGSGNWDTSSLNWNNGSGDVAWSQISTTAGTNSAIFGGGDGSYAINNAVQIAVTNLTVNNSGYTFSGSSIDLQANGLLALATGKSVVFNCNFASGNNPEYYWCNGGASMTFNGNFGGEQCHFAGPATCAFYLDGINTPSVLYVNSPVYLTGGSLTTAASFFVAYDNTVNGTNYTAGNLTISGGATATQNGGTFVIARGGGQGTVTLLDGAINVGVAGSTIRNLPICNDGSGSEHGLLNVYGGTVTVGTPTLAGQILLSSQGSLAGESSILNQTNGVIYAYGGVEFGSASGTYSGGSAMLTNSGGSLYIGAGGIIRGAVYPPTNSITLSGGAVGALGNWSSTLPLTLATNNGNITFQCSDENNTPYNISLAGPLTGAGGLNVTGGGTLTLSGTNSYTGTTTISNGVLALTTSSGNNGAYELFTNSTLSVQTAGSGSSLAMSSLTAATGSTLDLNSSSVGNPSAAFINISGALSPTSTVTINLSGALTNGEFPLIKYGSLGGLGFNAFQLGLISLPAGISGSASLVNDTANNSIDLNLTTYPAGRLVWNGTVNGNWDINATPNWQTNAYYTQTVSGGPVVVFDDTAAGPYTAIALNTLVAPAGVIFSNTALAYSLGGSGGIEGITGLIKTGTGVVTLGGANTYNGGTTIYAGTLALTTTNNAPMAYTNLGGMLDISAVSTGDSLASTSLAFGNSSPQLTFNEENEFGLTVPCLDDSGNLAMDGNVTVNVTNPAPGTTVLLQYASARAGAGSFVPGNLPAGCTLTDNLAASNVVLTYAPVPQAIVPIFNTNETVVSVVTPQDFGAKGDGVTDDSAAFQNAMNWVYNNGNWGGGVIFVPAANYAFYTNLTVPEGVTLHGDWTDWTTGTNGLVGTTFKICFGAGQTNAPPFIFMEPMSTIRGINFWYPNQNPTDITGYPFTIQISGQCVVKNVVLVNSYQGIEGTVASYSDEHILSTVIGTPLYLGISLDMLPDVSHTEDIRFSPYVWPASQLTNAPAVGDPYQTWMRSNGEGMRLLRVDGELSMNTFISGYNVGIEANSSTNGAPGATFYDGAVTNCGTALLAQQMPGQSGLQITDFTLDGDMAVNRTTNSSDATIGFDHCTLIGRKGTAVHSIGADWHSWMAFQNCTISNTLQLAGPGVLNLVDCTLQGSTQCVMSANVTRVAFTGCAFNSPTNIINSGNVSNLLMDARQSISNTLPIVYWTNVLNDYASRRPAQTNLYVVTAAPWGAYGNGINDDTVAIQSALTAAGTNGGGIVYLPGGRYHLTNTLDVPSGVELRGVREMRGGDGIWPDGKSKASVLEPYEGQGITNGPVALALEANSGIVGVNFNYETQNTNCYAFPPTIQGRGANVYAIGIVCPNAFYYVDLDTYTCTNHLIYMADGSVLSTGMRVGNGSAGSIVDCQGNQTYWLADNDSSYALPPSGSPLTAVLNYTATNAQMYVLGNCKELMLSDFNINENTLLHYIAENGQGPDMTGIATYCDGTVQGYVLDAAASCTINVVNSPMAVFSTATTGLTNDTVGVISTTNFQGTARFFNTALFGGPAWDFVINSGDVGFDLVHMLDHAYNGSSVSGGVLHLVNNGAYITDNGPAHFPPYNVTFGTNAGVAGKVSEIIGEYAYSGCTYTNVNTNNPVNVWNDYALDSYSVLSRTNQFDATEPPPPNLSFSFDSTTRTITLTWPGGTGAFYVFTTPTLTPPVVWSQVTNSPTYSNGQWTLVLSPNDEGEGFYRLRTLP